MTFAARKLFDIDSKRDFRNRRVGCEVIAGGRVLRHDTFGCIKVGKHMKLGGPGIEPWLTSNFDANPSSSINVSPTEYRLPSWSRSPTTDT